MATTQPGADEARRDDATTAPGRPRATDTVVDPPGPGGRGAIAPHPPAAAAPAQAPPAIEPRRRRGLRVVLVLLLVILLAAGGVVAYVVVSDAAVRPPHPTQRP